MCCILSILHDLVYGGKIFKILIPFNNIHSDWTRKVWALIFKDIPWNLNLINKYQIKTKYVKMKPVNLYGRL